MRTERIRRIRARFSIEPDAKTEFYRYVSMSAFSHDIGAAFGDLAHFGLEIVASGMTLRQAREMLRTLNRDSELKRRVKRLLGRQAAREAERMLAEMFREG